MATVKVVTADPFIPDGWGWFRLANVPVRGRLVSVTYDRDGTHYGRGKGLRIASEGSRGAGELYGKGKGLRIVSR